MAIDQREWYRDWWRKRTGYLERSLFRMGEGEIARVKQGAAWRRNLLVAAALVVSFVAFVVTVKLLKR